MEVLSCPLTGCDTNVHHANLPECLQRALHGSTLHARFPERISQRSKLEPLFAGYEALNPAQAKLPSPATYLSLPCLGEKRRSRGRPVSWAKNEVDVSALLDLLVHEPDVVFDDCVV